jgi:hypothetical protein
MKKFVIPFTIPFVILFVVVSLMAACSNPVLKWIDTPAAGNRDRGRMAGEPNAKEIVSFSFGIAGEADLPFGKDHDITGRIPIAIILPMGTGLNSLTPTITFIGKSLNPPSGRTGDFSSPVVYRVTAEDDSTVDYVVTVHEKGPSTKEIVRFAIDVSRAGGSAISAEGVINEDPIENSITVIVPAGTNLQDLTAHVAHTGAEARDPWGEPHVEALFSYNGDFSEPSSWKVVAQDSTEKTYTVRVVKEKDSAKAITKFSFGLEGETVIIGGEPQPDGKYPIVAVVSENADLDNRSPTLLEFQGASISPEQETSQNFTSPATYTVTAEDGSTRDYAVKIVLKNDIAADEKQITGFYFVEPLVEGVIDQVNHTIALTVPQGTDLSALRPEIYYRGASISPVSGQPRDFTNPVTYTVRAQNNSSQAYTVSVFTAPAPPSVDVAGSGGSAKVDTGTSADTGDYIVIVENPTHVENPTLNINYPGAAAADNTTLNEIINKILKKGDVFNHITNNYINNYITENNTNNYDYSSILNTEVGIDITVINPPPENTVNSGDSDPVNPNQASIDSFYFTNPAAVGEINQSTGAISVKVPAGTNLNGLKAVISYTGKEIEGIAGASPLENTRSFVNTVDYTVKSRDEGTRKSYTVTVSAYPSAAKEITGFSFTGISQAKVIISAVPNVANEYPIEVMVPAGQDITSLTAQITHTGASITGQTSANFSSPVPYKVTAEDGSYRTYVVNVHKDADTSEKIITGFYFTNPLVEGVIDQAGHTIALTVPAGTNLNGLTPTIYYKGASVSPASGQSLDFTYSKANPVRYTVRAQDNSTKDYTVSVFTAPAPPVVEVPVVNSDVTVDTKPGADAGSENYIIIVEFPTYIENPTININYPGAIQNDNSTINAIINQTLQNKEVYNHFTTEIINDNSSYTDIDTDLAVDVTVINPPPENPPSQPSSSEASIDGFYFTNPAAVGEIDNTTGNGTSGNPYTISVTVPYGTSLSSLKAGICYTGKEIEGITGTSPLEDIKSFASPVDYTVKAQDETTTKTYRVTVTAAQNNAKEITALSFSGIRPANTKVIISAMPNAEGKYPIEVTVPAGQDITSLTARINHTGVSITGQTSAVNFGSSSTTPIEYTVTAEDSTTKIYAVTVRNEAADDIPTITSFYFTNPQAVGKINQSTGAISVKVPYGTNLGNLKAGISYTGLEIVGIPGANPLEDTRSFISPVDYTVKARNGVTTKTYRVTVEKAKNDAKEITAFAFGDISQTDTKVIISAWPNSGGKYPIEVTVPSWQIVTTLTAKISHTGASITGQGVSGGPGTVSGSAVDFSSSSTTPVDYTVTAEDGTTRTYTVTVRRKASADDYPEIQGFYFTNPAAVGEINQTAGTITVKVPYGTDRRNLTAGICYTGLEISGLPGASPLKDTRSFANPVDYEVRSRDGVTKTYTVTVSAALNTAKEITAFSFDGIDSSSIISAMPNAGGKYPIEVTVPAGQSKNALTARITHTGNSIMGQGVTGGSGTVTGSATNFSSPVDYTVTAEDGTTKTYIVTVRHEAPEDDPEILGFYFTNPLAAGVVNNNTNTITVTVPSNTNTQALMSVVYFKGISLKPASGLAHNFGSPVIYTVTGITGETRSYTVTVNRAPSSAKDITRFTFPGVADAETIIGAVPDSTGTYPIAVWIPAGMALDNLAPVITHTGAGISPAGGVPQSFNAPQNYTVTAEDGTVKTYRVTVNPVNTTAKIITSFIFNEVPLTGGGAVRVVGSIDQGSHTITVTVPFTADISALIPSLTYIGRSIAESGGSDRTENPFTGTAKDFSGGQTYTVKDQSGVGEIYTVTVIKQSAITAAFMGETDRAIISGNVFDQNTGVITITADSGIGGPYEWYVDGVKQAVGGSTTFTLNIGNGGFTPGRHEIMAAVKTGGLYYTGKVFFDVSR